MPRRLFGSRGALVGLALFLAVAGLPAAVSPSAAQELPTIPAPVPVTLDAATTALLMLDFNTAVCPPRPMCMAALPRAAELLARARRANVFVAHSNTRAPGATLLPEVAALPDEPVVVSSANKFYGTPLEEVLTAQGVTTLLIAGTAANGAVLYTAFGANERGFTVAVAEDLIPATTDFDVFLTRYQLLNQPGFSNPQNEPLREGAVTLTRSDLVTFR